MVGITKLISLLTSLLTMLTSLITVANRQQTPDIIQDFLPKSNTEIIRVMSFNIRCLGVGNDTWEDRIGIVTETMVKSKADSIGVQEATTDWMKTLRAELKDYASVGVGRDDGKDGGEHSAIFYLKDKYNLIDSGTFWLSETPDVPSKDWGSSLNRICTWAILENKSTGQKYVHLNSHFDHVSSKARENSSKLILEKAKEYPDLPVVFTADMNVKEGSENYITMTSGCLKDTKYIAHDTMNYLTYHDTKPQSNRDNIIDYVMVNDRFDAVSYKVVTAGIDGRYVSDHFPLYADLIIK